MKKVVLATIFLVLPLVSTCFAYEYDIVDLGPGIPYDLNNNGISVGVSNGMPCIWNNNGNKTLIDIKGCAYGINDHNQVVGSSQGNAFLWESRQLNLFEDIIGAYSINNNEEIAGKGWRYDGDYYLDDLKYWKDGQWFTTGNAAGIIGVTGDKPTIAINEQGIIAFSYAAPYSPNPDIKSHTYNIYSNQIISSVDFVSKDINNSNQIVGVNPYNLTGQFWDGTKEIELNEFRCANAINDEQKIVGDGYVDSYLSALFWEQGIVQDFNCLIPVNSGWHLESAQAINDYGQIVGYGRYNGEIHAFLLNPVPEPSTILMFLSGIFGMFWFRKKK